MEANANPNFLYVCVRIEKDLTPSGSRLFLGPPNGLLLRALEELVGFLHWRVPYYGVCIGGVMTLRAQLLSLLMLDALSTNLERILRRKRDPRPVKWLIDVLLVLFKYQRPTFKENNQGTPRISKANTTWVVTPRKDAPTSTPHFRTSGLAKKEATIFSCN